jgi:hypothetical protein
VASLARPAYACPLRTNAAAGARVLANGFDNLQVWIETCQIAQKEANPTKVLK